MKCTKRAGRLDWRISCTLPVCDKPLNRRLVVAPGTEVTTPSEFHRVVGQLEREIAAHLRRDKPGETVDRPLPDGKRDALVLIGVGEFISFDYNIRRYTFVVRPTACCLRDASAVLNR